MIADQPALEAEQAGGEGGVEAGADRGERQQVRERRERALVPNGDQHQPHQQQVQDRARSRAPASRARSRRRASAPSAPAASTSTRGPGARTTSRGSPLACGSGRGLRIAVAAGPWGGPCLLLPLVPHARPRPLRWGRRAPTSSSSSRNAGPIRARSQRPARTASSASGTAAARNASNSSGRSSSVGETTRHERAVGVVREPDESGLGSAADPHHRLRGERKAAQQPARLARSATRAAPTPGRSPRAGRRGRDQDASTGHDDRAPRHRPRSPRSPTPVRRCPDPAGRPARTRRRRRRRPGSTPGRP